jgi:hypothetical protein
MNDGAQSEVVWWTAASVIKGREYKSPYDWCQLNNHQGAIGEKSVLDGRGAKEVKHHTYLVVGGLGVVYKHERTAE